MITIRFALYFRSMNQWIADAGGTKTSWLSSEGQLLEGVGVNPNTMSENEIIDSIPQVVRESNLTELYFYGAGCSSEASVQKVMHAFQQVFPLSKRIEINHDILGACRALCGHQPGIAGILGTGSNSALFDGQNIVKTVASPGFLFADEGGGTWLGKRLLLAYFRSDFSAGLQREWAVAYPEWDTERLIRFAYGPELKGAWFASFVPFLYQHLESFPEIKLWVIEGFSLFIDQHLMRYPEAKQLPIHFTGSVAHFFHQQLNEALELKGMQLGRIVRRPIEGLAAFHEINFKRTHV